MLPKEQMTTFSHSIYKPKLIQNLLSDDFSLLVAVPESSVLSYLPTANPGWLYADLQPIAVQPFFHSTSLESNVRNLSVLHMTFTGGTNPT